MWDKKVPLHVNICWSFQHWVTPISDHFHGYYCSIFSLLLYHCNVFEDRVPRDEICGDPIFKWVEVKWIELNIHVRHQDNTWWRHQMETFFALLALCEGNSPVIGEFPSQRASNAGFGVFCDVSLNIRLHKQLWAGDLRRHDGHCDVIVMYSTRSPTGPSCSIVRV